VIAICEATPAATTGSAHSIDISALSPARFGTGATLREYNVV